MAGGCVSGPTMDYIRQEYTGVPVVLYATAEDEYRIFDKPDAGKMMITPSLSRAAGIGGAKGASYGLVDNSQDTRPWAAAAGAYLASTGRACRIVSAELLMNPQYEVKYDCSAAAQTPAAKRR